MIDSKSTQKSNSPFPMGGRPGGMHIGGAAEKAKDFKGTLRKLVEYLRPHWKSMILVFIFAIGSTIFSILSPKILGNITNQVVDDYINMKVYDQVVQNLPKGASIPPGTSGSDVLKNIPPAITQKIPSDKIDKVKDLDFSKRPEINFNKIGNTILFLIGLYLLSALLSYIQGWVMSSISQKVTYKFREKISKKINLLPLKYFDSVNHGDILSRVTNDVDTISQSLNQSITQMITSITMILGILIMMFSISWTLTLVALLVLPLSFLFIAIIIKKSQKYFKELQNTLGELNGHVEEMYSGHNVMKVFNGEERSLKKFHKINKKLYTSSWKSQFLSGLMMPIMNIVGNLGYVGIAVLGGRLAIKGTINIGDIQAFIQYMRQFTQPIAQAASSSNVLQSTAAAAERVFEFLAESEEIKDIDNPIILDTVKGSVNFRNVKFGYDPQKLVIKDFNIQISAGQRIAIVGPTGAGKTTLVNLLMRFYDVTSGSIEVDGVDIRNLRRSDLRKIFGMVLQDTWLFNGTLKENIIYGKQNATEEEILSTSKAAHVDHFVHSLAGGYDMMINEEADNISQGEKQLLTIARAMLVNPPILILDEATSSVDTRTEVLIQNAMKNLMRNRTNFVIAHRLSTIREADLILVMNEGRLIEQGTHKELLSQNGFYANLYNSQFTGALIE